jgi:hypothetical protein
VQIRKWSLDVVKHMWNGADFLNSVNVYLGLKEWLYIQFLSTSTPERSSAEDKEGIEESLSYFQRQCDVTFNHRHCRILLPKVKLPVLVQVQELLACFQPSS